MPDQAQYSLEEQIIETLKLAEEIELDIAVEFLKKVRENKTVCFNTKDLRDQLIQVQNIANKNGLYDAADWVREIASLVS